jgi:hypothetical protein
MKTLSLLALLLVTSLAFAEFKPSAAAKISIGIRKSDAKEETIARPAANGRHEFTLKAPGDYIISVREQKAEVRDITKGIMGVKVSLGRNPTGRIVARTTTDDKGEATFKGLAAGSYFIELQAAATAPKNPDLAK